MTVTGHATIEIEARTTEVLRESDGHLVALVEIYTRHGSTLRLLDRSVYDPRQEPEAT